MKLAVIGTGYVGLVAGVCFADAGNDVVCVDIDPDKVEALKRGEVPIYEPGLAAILERAIRDERISFTTSHADAVPGADAIFIAVGTPEGPDGRPVLKYVDAAVTDCLKATQDETVVVLKSTVPVGTADRVRKIASEVASHPVLVVNNPEFLKEGDALSDFLTPDRIVVGADNERAFKVMERLYRPFVRHGKPILRMSNVAAEITKYASNAMLATRISFVNEIARLCDAVGADIRDVTAGMGSDRRIGKAFLYAGCGYGGSCFPKDTQGLIHVAQDAGIDMRLVKATEEVNDQQKLVLWEKVKRRFGEDLRGMRFCLWGLSFKPQTDDVREAPALVLARKLVDAGASVVGTDPEAIDNFKQAFGEGMEFEADAYKAAEGADCLVLMTEWNEFRGTRWLKLRDNMKGRVLFDGRNVLDRDHAEEVGFEYDGIGQGITTPAPAEQPA